jgi:hypothetical protein
MKCVLDPFGQPHQRSEKSLQSARNQVINQQILGVINPGSDFDLVLDEDDY